MKYKSDLDAMIEKEIREDPTARKRLQEAGEELNLALKIAEVRKKAGLTQKQLAERVGTTQQQISRLERLSYRGHSVRELTKLASALGMTVSVNFKRPAKIGARTPATRVRQAAASSK